MSLARFDRPSRPALLRSMSEGTLDLLVIGGGITGASVFRDAAQRGMRVGLVEARDFASGTSGRSSKMIHGGLRYLRGMGLRLARESCEERNLHVKLNKRLVSPMPFLVPLYRNSGPSRATMRLGMGLYEVLSGFGNHRLHRFPSREETLTMAPALPEQGLTGGCLYYDAATNDVRWTMEIVKDGVRFGGAAVNYAPLLDFVKEKGRIVGGVVEDQLEGGRYEVRARAVVNATGVFSDGLRRMDDPACEPLIRLSKGTHLVFAEEDVPLSVTVAFSSPLDGRPLFLARHEGCFLYGTSDAWEDADPGSPVPGEPDVEYLMASLQRFMPEADLGRDRVRFVYSGFRPLLTPARGVSSAGAAREDHIEVSSSGLISAVGGKLTTARVTATRVLEKVLAQGHRRGLFGPCRTHVLSIGGTNEAVAEGMARWVRHYPRLSWYFRVLYGRYGLDAHEVCAEAAEIYRRGEGDPLRAEASYVCRNEMVCTLEDLIERRAGFLHWDGEKRLERLRYGRRAIQTALGLSDEAFDFQYTAYERYLASSHALP
jgi:glycerol-3-phosphate dehydrogenase